MTRLLGLTVLDVQDVAIGVATRDSYPKTYSAFDLSLQLHKVPAETLCDLTHHAVVIDRSIGTDYEDADPLKISETLRARLEFMCCHDESAASLCILHTVGNAADHLLVNMRVGAIMFALDDDFSAFCCASTQNLNIVGVAAFAREYHLALNHIKAKGSLTVAEESVRYVFVSCIRFCHTMSPRTSSARQGRRCRQANHM